MQNASDQKNEMEELKRQAAEEDKVLQTRKKAIDRELAEVEPLVRAAKSAVGNIKTESLSEIRSLRAPPDTIRDILEGVLRLMGIFDTSWVSMKRWVFAVKSYLRESQREIFRCIKCIACKFKFYHHEYN